MDERYPLIIPNQQQIEDDLYTLLDGSLREKSLLDAEQDVFAWGLSQWKLVKGTWIPFPVSSEIRQGVLRQVAMAATPKSIEYIVLNGAYRKMQEAQKSKREFLRQTSGVVASTTMLDSVHDAFISLRSGEYFLIGVDDVEGEDAKRLMNTLNHYKEPEIREVVRQLAILEHVKFKTGNMTRNISGEYPALTDSLRGKIGFSSIFCVQSETVELGQLWPATFGPLPHQQSLEKVIRTGKKNDFKMMEAQMIEFSKHSELANLRLLEHMYTTNCAFSGIRVDPMIVERYRMLRGEDNHYDYFKKKEMETRLSTDQDNSDETKTSPQMKAIPQTKDLALPSWVTMSELIKEGILFAAHSNGRVTPIIEPATIKKWNIRQRDFFQTLYLDYREL